MNDVCCVENCSKRVLVKSRRLCVTHYHRWHEYGDANVVVRKKNEPGLGCLTNGYKIFVKGKVAKGEHVLIAEHVLGRPLPKGAEVHHVNEIKNDNRNENLVICPSKSYHNLLHARARAYDICGHADWVLCRYCHQYGPKEEMVIMKVGRNRHQKCIWKDFFGVNK